MFHGPYHDYEPMWYVMVGWLILKTMIINIILPIVALVMGHVLPKMKRKKDRYGTKDRYKTK